MRAPVGETVLNQFPAYSGELSFQLGERLVGCLIGLASRRIVIKTPDGTDSSRTGIKPALLLAVEHPHLSFLGGACETLQIALRQHVIQAVAICRALSVCTHSKPILSRKTVLKSIFLSVFRVRMLEANKRERRLRYTRR